MRAANVQAVVELRNVPYKGRAQSFAELLDIELTQDPTFRGLADSLNAQSLPRRHEEQLTQALETLRPPMPGVAPPTSAHPRCRA